MDRTLGLRVRDAGSNPVLIFFLVVVPAWPPTTSISNQLKYFLRLMVVHLGLPEWHFLFSNIPVSNKARQWFNFFAPTRLLLSSHHIAVDNHSSSADGERRNPNAVFETPLVQNKFDAGNIVQLIVVDIKELCFLSNNNAFLEILSSIFIRPFDHEV